MSELQGAGRSGGDASAAFYADTRRVGGVVEYVERMPFMWLRSVMAGVCVQGSISS